MRGARGPNSRSIQLTVFDVYSLFHSTYDAFSVLCLPYPSLLAEIISTPSHPRSGYRVESIDFTSPKVCSRAVATKVRRKFRDFRDTVTLSVLTKCISQNFHLGPYFAFGIAKI